MRIFKIHSGAGNKRHPRDPHHLALLLSLLKSNKKRIIIKMFDSEFIDKCKILNIQIGELFIKTEKEVK
jgi:hypothetical protein